MEDALIQILEGFGYPVYRQGSLTEEQEYPECFFTFWNNNSPDHAHYDNDNYGTAWDFSIYFYSVDPAQTYSVLSAARAALKQAGWVVPSQGYDVQSDEATHTGRAIDVYYLQV